MKYGPAIREATLRRILPPNSEPMSQVSRDTGISLQTLFNWKSQAEASGLSFSEETDTAQYTSQERIRIFVETYSLNETELAEYARTKGVYVEQIRQWREIVEHCFETHAMLSKSNDKALKEKDKQIKALQDDLDRKDKALAEVAALEILRKKAMAIWGDPKEK